MKTESYNRVPSIRTIRVKFLLALIYGNIKTAVRRILRTIPVIFSESYDNIKKNGWKEFIWIYKENHRCGWQTKICIGILIIDLNWYMKYPKDYDEESIGNHYGICIWFNSWTIVKIWGSCGSNMALLFSWYSTKKLSQTKFRLNPVTFLQKVAILQKVYEIEHIYSEICDDPMNGCPDDFAEEGDRKVGRLMAMYYSL